MNILEPKNKQPWSFTLSISATKLADEAEAAWLKKTYTVFLGQCYGFDYWGCPEDGRVISVGNDKDGTRSSNFGDRHHWRMMSQRGEMTLTEAGRKWGE